MNKLKVYWIERKNYREKWFDSNVILFFNANLIFCVCVCVCVLVNGVQVRPDPLPYRNDKRRQFCLDYHGYGDFCSGKNA